MVVPGCGLGDSCEPTLSLGPGVGGTVQQQLSQEERQHCTMYNKVTSTLSLSYGQYSRYLDLYRSLFFLNRFQSVIDIYYMFEKSKKLLYTFFMNL